MRKPLASKSYSFEAVGTIGEGLTQCGEPVLVGSEGALQQGNGTRDEGWVSLPGRQGPVSLFVKWPRARPPLQTGPVLL